MLLAGGLPHASPDTDGLPRAKQGRFPVHMPTYDGVEQLIVLSSRCIVVVTTNVDEVVEKINDLSGGQLFAAVQRWEESDAAGRPDWKAYRDRWRIRDDYIARAREAAGERKLGETSYYTITAHQPPSYRAGLAPRRVTRVIVGLGGQRVKGSHAVHYAHYSYLELPEPLWNGNVYTVALGNGKKVTFLYDEMRTVSRAIKVSQIGYLPSAQSKYAYLGACLYELGPLDCSFAEEFKVVSVETGQVLHRGAVKLRARNPRVAPRPGKDDDPEKRPLMAGEDIYEMDLSALKDEGEFFITVPGVGRSWPFRHAKDVYAEAFYTACRGLYHQRCGIALQPQYTAWTRIKCHTDPVYECEHIPFSPGANFRRPEGYSTFDVIGATVDASRATESPRGGWHDAADWDRNIYHYSCVFDLLYAYELAPTKFTDGQLNIPESGNGIPDILDEAEFGIEIWKRSMDENGGVSGAVETWTHPKIDDPDVKYCFSRRTRWSSLLFAAAAAQYAYLAKPHSARRAAEYESLAKRAYAFGSDPRNSLGEVTINAKKERGRGDPYAFQWREEEGMISGFLAHAKLRLYVLTGDESYLERVPDLVRDVLEPYEWTNSYKDFSPWMYFDIAAKAAPRLPAEAVSRWRAFYLGRADELVELLDGMPYRCTWPDYKDFWMGWGASDMTNYSRALLIAHALSGDERYRDAAILNADFMFGANPLGMSWTTGLGYVYPIDIQHANSENDGIMDPVPGITIYGITGGMYSQLRNAVWRSPTADGATEYVSFMSEANMSVPLWRRWSCHPHLNVGQCEFTVHETMASTIFACAMLMPQGWMPSEALKGRRPRAEEFLFGYWYLP
jgi:endoglucanase